MNKISTYMFICVLFLIGIARVWAVADGQGNEVFAGGNLGVGTATPQGRLVVTNGNMGIGTWVPVHLLDIVGDINADGVVGGVGVTTGWTYSNGMVRLTTAGDNLGLGTSTPQAVLSVLGAVGIGTWAGSSGTGLTVMNGNVGIGSFVPEVALVVAGPMVINAANDITAAPPVTPQSNNGWKLCTRSAQCWGVSTNEVAIKVGSAGSLQLFGGLNPTAAAGNLIPDNNAGVAFLGSGNGTSYFRGNLGVGTWMTGVNALSVIGNVGITTLSNLAYVYTAAPSGGMIVQGNVGMGTWTPQTNLAVMGPVGIGTWSVFSGVAVSVPSGNVGIGTTAPKDKLIVMEGNVGIGTWAPGSSLIIQGGNLGIGTAAALRARVEVLSNTPDVNMLGTVMATSSQNASLVLNNTSSTGGRWDFIAGTEGAAAYMAIKDGTTGQTTLTLTSSNAVGIGTWHPSNILAINAGVSPDQGGIGIGTIAYSPYIYTKAPFGGVIMEGNMGIGTYSSTNRLDVRGSAAVGSFGGVQSAPSNGLIVSGNMGIATSSPQTALSVLGNMGIGTWTAAGGNLIVMAGNVGIGTVTPQTLLAVVGGNVGLGTWTAPHMLELGIDSAAKPGGGAWAATSDARLKKGVVPIQGALAKLTRLQGVEFTWIHPAEHGGRAGSAGFLAQDVQKVFPQFVSESACQGMDCALTGGAPVENITLPVEFQAYVVEAIKERVEQNKKLLVRIEALEKKIDRRGWGRHD